MSSIIRSQANDLQFFVKHCVSFLRLNKNKINQNTPYKVLQNIARFMRIPCNMKKEVMMTVIEARINGKEEMVNAIVKKVKTERSLRRQKMKEETARLKELNSQSLKLVKTEEHMVTERNKKESIPVLKKVMVKKIMKETLSKTAKTEMMARCRRRINPNRLTGITTCSVSPNVESTPSLRSILPGKPTTEDRILRSLLTSSPPIYSSTPMKLGSVLVSNFAPREYGDIPQPTNRLPGLAYNPGQMSNCLDLSLDNLLGSPPQQSRTGFCTPLSNTCLPPFHELNSKMTALYRSFTQIEQDPIEFVDSKNTLDFFAQMATNLMEQDFDRPIEGEYPCTTKACSISGTELAESNSKSNLQDIPTWNNFLEQYSSRLQATMTKCKFECPALFQSKEEKMRHEALCHHQPYHCPAINCSWVNQLGSLATHIFTYHNEQVVLQSEATFTLDFGNETAFGPNGQFESGPKRQTFFQLVNYRLFVTFVIGNFHNMQLYIYVQFVDDFSNWLSTGAIEVLRPDGVPYQWKGRLSPLSCSSTRLVTNRRCLILNMNNFARVKRFVVHVKIRNHEPSC